MDTARPGREKKTARVLAFTYMHARRAEPSTQKAIERQQCREKKTWGVVARRTGQVPALERKQKSQNNSLPTYRYSYFYPLRVATLGGVGANAALQEIQGCIRVVTLPAGRVRRSSTSDGSGRAGPGQAGSGGLQNVTRRIGFGFGDPTRGV